MVFTLAASKFSWTAGFGHLPGMMTWALAARTDSRAREITWMAFIFSSQPAERTKHTVLYEMTLIISVHLGIHTKRLRWRLTPSCSPVLLGSSEFLSFVGVFKDQSHVSCSPSHLFTCEASLKKWCENWHLFTWYLVLKEASDKKELIDRLV